MSKLAPITYTLFKSQSFKIAAFICVVEMLGLKSFHDWHFCGMMKET